MVRYMTNDPGDSAMQDEPPGGAAPAATPAMPPLGPPYAAPNGAEPPAPRFPGSPPEEWPSPPPVLYADGPLGAGSSPPRGPVPTLVLVAIATAVGLLIGALAYTQTGNTDTALPAATTFPAASPTTSAAPTSTTAEPSTAALADLNRVIADIKAFVEQERGLRFTAEVPVQLAGGAEFTRLLLADFEEHRPQLVELGQVLRGLGLVPANEDVVADQRILLEAGVGGFYDPKTKRLVVRGTDTSPFVRQVLAHELTHALDDQHFGLDRPALDTADDETGFGFSALVEGNARRVEDAYYSSLSSSDQLASEREQLALVTQRPDLQRLPPVLLSLLQSPYTDGESLVASILGAGGQARLDAAFASPPTTSEQVLDPSKYLSGHGAVAVAAPEPAGGAAAANRGSLGALLLVEVLDQASGDYSTVAEGWGGDQYVTWTDGSRTCVRDQMLGDDPVATARIGEALAAWARTNGATVEQRPDGSLQMTRCTG